MFKSKITAVALMLMSAAIFYGCGKNATSTEDYSTSGSVAALVGGANTSSGSSGSLAWNEPSRSDNAGFLQYLKGSFSISDAMASTTCPTIGGTASGCSLSGTTLTMTYSTCNFANSAVTWNGSQVIAFSTGSPTCSAFPTSYTGTITRTFGSSTTRTAPSGSVVTVNTSSTTAADGNTYSGGTTVTFSSGSRTQIAINGINLVTANAAGTTLFNHTLTTSPSGGTAAPLTISSGTITGGTVTTFHNLAKVQASSTFNNVAFTSGCCLPTSGSITTTFSKITGVTPLKSGFSGATETLTFTGCGTATYTGPEGYTGNVTLAHCL